MHLLLPSIGGGPSSRERRRQVPFHPFSSPSPKEISACLLPYSGFPTTLSHLGESLPKDTRGPFQVQSGYRGRPGGRCGRELAGSPTSPPEPKLRGRCLGGGGGGGAAGVAGPEPTCPSPADPHVRAFLRRENSWVKDGDRFRRPRQPPSCLTAARRRPLGIWGPPGRAVPAVLLSARPSGSNLSEYRRSLKGKRTRRRGGRECGSPPGHWHPAPAAAEAQTLLQGSPGSEDPAVPRPGPQVLGLDRGATFAPGRVSRRSGGWTPLLPRLGVGKGAVWGCRADDGERAISLPQPTSRKQVTEKSEGSGKINK